VATLAETTRMLRRTLAVLVGLVAVVGATLVVLLAIANSSLR
jgi:hypothetical protein